MTNVECRSVSQRVSSDFVIRNSSLDILKMELPAGISPATSAFEARRADNCATGAKGTKEDHGEQTFACRAHNTAASQKFFNPLSSFEMGPSTCVQPMRFARSAVAVRRHLLLLSNIGEMVGRHGAAPCSAV